MQIIFFINILLLFTINSRGGDIPFIRGNTFPSNFYSRDTFSRDSFLKTKIYKNKKKAKGEIPEESKERLPRQSLALLSRNDDKAVGPE